jgi:hypothetical protein
MMTREWRMNIKRGRGEDVDYEGLNMREEKKRDKTLSILICEPYREKVSIWV